MSFMNILERLSQVTTNYKQTCYSDYKSIVVAIADGEEPDHERTRDVLLANDKTVEDLQDDVKLLLERRELRTQYDALPELHQRKAENEQKIAEADRVLESAQQRHDEQTAPFYSRLYDINKTIKAGNAAMQQLYDTCNDPDLIDEQRRLHEDAVRESNREQHLRDQIRKLQSDADSCRQESERYLQASRRNELQAEAKSLETQVRKHERELTKVQKRSAEIEDARKELVERMREV